MKKHLLYFYLLASFFGMGQAIKFGKLGSGLENNGYYSPVRSIFYDTLDKKLYAAGQFNTTGDGKTVWGAAVWHNNIWDSLRGGFTQFPQSVPGIADAGTYTWKIIRFQNKIYFAGGIVWVNGHNQYHMGVWNGNNWDYPIAQPPNGDVKDLVVYNNTLYACGDFTKFGNTTCNYVAKFDGISWQPVGDFSKFHLANHPPAQMNAIQVYNNEIYVGGAFDDTTGMSQNIAKFDGTKWASVGTGIRQGGVNSVFALEEFNHKLYIGGRFGRSQEIPGESMVIWNGSEYKEVNSNNINGGQISTFKKHKNKLFVTGYFDKYGPLTAYNVFYIDTSNNGCVIDRLNDSYGDLTTMYNIERIDFINDSLVVAGLFTKLDTVYANDIGVITNYDNGSSCVYVGIKENIFENDLIKVYPNPVKDKLNIELSIAGLPGTRLTLINSLGQMVYLSEEVEQNQEIDLSSLARGIYYLKINNSSQQKVVKIIKD